MAKSTFVKCWINGVDISESIESIRYESDVKKGDLIELRCKSDKALDLANSKNMVAGARIEYQYGLINGVQSSVRLARVGNIEVNYDSSRVQLTIKATDKGIEIKKGGGGSKVWNNVTLSDVAKEIASKYGLTDEKIGKTFLFYKSMPQGTFSDWEFLNYLIVREPAAWQIYVDGVDLVLEKNVRNRVSRRLFTLGENIIAFRTALKEISQKSPLSDTGKQLSIINEDKAIGEFGFSYSFKKGSFQSKEVENVREYETKDGRFSVDKIQLMETKNGVKSVLKSNTITSKVQTVAYKNSKTGGAIYKDVFVPTNSEAESNNMTENANNDNKVKVLTGDLKIEFDPFILCRDVISLSLPVDRHSGNWYVEKAVHTVDSGGAITELSLNKNGVNATVKNYVEANEGKVNTSTGEAKIKEVSKVRFSGVSGLEVTGGGILGKNSLLGR